MSAGRQRDLGWRATPAFTAAVILSCLSPPTLVAQSISTVVGGGTIDGRPATLVPLNRPTDVAVDSTGNLFIAERSDNRVRRVDISTGIMTTVAGNGADGFGGDGGPATLASLDWPTSIALDPAGNLFIADSRNDRIRRVDASGTITTVAGNGERRFSGDGGPATLASLNGPESMALDALGNLFIADLRNQRIRRVDSASGIITTVAGNGESAYGGDSGPATQASLSFPSDVVSDPGGTLVIADRINHRVRRVDSASGIITTVAGTGESTFSGDTGPATLASLSFPSGMALDADGNLYVADEFNQRIRRIDANTGIISTVAGGGQQSNGDGAPATQASVSSPKGVTLDSVGHLYIAGSFKGRIRRVDASTGIITTIAGNGESHFSGDDGPATQASVHDPTAVAFDPAGNLHIAESSLIRRVIASTGVITTVAGVGDFGSFGGDDGPATQASLNDPSGLDFDATGNLYIADSGNGRIRRVDASTGIITTVAGHDGEGFSGDGGPATQASFFPSGLAVDPAGNIYIADSDDSRIRRVDASTGIISTVAGNGEDGFSGDGGPATQASVRNPEDVALDPVGNIYIADLSRIRRVDASTGIITTVAGSGDSGGALGDGGPATQASLSIPEGVKIDLDGNLYIVDGLTARIRRVDASTEIITTVAGNGLQGFRGDNGPATQASLFAPSGVTLDSTGNLYIADRSSNRIRAVLACVEIADTELTTPANASAGLPLSLNLGWSATPGAFGYDVYLDTAHPPQQVIAANIGPTSFSPTNLKSLTTYYWKVNAKGDQYCDPLHSAESEVWSFTTTSSCELPGSFEGN